jgi:hypothetical protein
MSGVVHRVLWWMLNEISKEIISSIYRTDCKMEASFLRNVFTYVPYYTGLQPKSTDNISRYEPNLLRNF